MLKPNQKIALIATGSCGQQTEVEQAAQLLKERYGHEVVFGAETYQHQNAQTRADCLLNYLKDPEVGLCWAVRGGEGTQDVLPFLHQQSDLIKQLEPTAFMGFSDLTPLLIYFAQTYGWQCVHGMGALQFVRLTPDDETVQKTDDLILNRAQPSVGGLKPLNALVENPPELPGEWIGGNLTLCAMSIKDCWEIQPAGKVLFFEDWMEKGYRVARSLKYLKRLGWFDQATALVLGDFFAKPLGNSPEEIAMQTKYFWKVIHEFADSLNIPVFHTTRIGHGKANDPVLLSIK